jgi:glycosyltransferase involved in cell wall biosynthesis
MFTSAALAGPWQRAGVIGPSHRTYEVVEGSSTFQPMPRERARLKSGLAGDPAVLWVGRLHAIKDPLAVLDGFERSLARLPNARLTMVYGGGDLLPIVRERVQASHALSARVWLAGRIPHEELRAFYSAADVFVLGSSHESCGFALIEACACGAPPVVTDIAAFRAITGGGSIGRLWACGDARACAEALLAVAQQDRDESRAHTRVHFEHRLSWPAVARAATQAYADLAARRRTEPA